MCGRVLSRAPLSSLCRSLAPAAVAGRFDEALYLARSVSRYVVASTLGTSLVLKVLSRAGRLWEAQQEAEEALARFDHDAELTVEYARILAMRGQVARAEALLVQ
eukprot:6177033-Pleurochrysis_carterae.AAC.1